MPSIYEHWIFKFLSQFAYQPTAVYCGTIGMMLASAFGLPIPEEVTLLSVGLLAFMGTRPDLFPPPSPGASVVNVHHAAIIGFIAVLGSDFLIYSLGRFYGRRIMQGPRFQKIFSPGRMAFLEEKMKKHGPVAAFIFRFTPGVRFPGHLLCGLSKFDPIKFGLVDGFAALISVPTQIYLVAFFGDTIVDKLRRYKLIFLGVVVTGGLIYYFYQRRQERSVPNE